MSPEELFAGAFKALVELGGAGWIVSGLFLLGLIFLYKENNRIRDRSEAIGERTVIALERVGAVNQNVATTLDGSTKSREDMARLLAEMARKIDTIEDRQSDGLADTLKSLRDLVEVQRNNERDFARLSAEHKEILDSVRNHHVELVKAQGRRQSSGG